MATRRRDIIPGREKRPATTTMASPTPRLTPKTPASTTPIHPKIGAAATSPDVSRQHHARRPLPSSANSPAPTRTTPALERKSPSIPQRASTTTMPQRPAHVSTLPSPRPSTSSRKPAPLQKSAPDREKSAKAPVKDAGKPRPAAYRSGPAAKRVGTNAKKQGAENSAAAMKGHVNQAAPRQKKVEHKKEPEVKTPNQEFFLSENEELTFRAVAGDHETGADGSEPAGLETYSIDQFEAENYKEPDIVAAEPSLIAEHKEVSAAVEKEEPEYKTFVEEESIKQQGLQKIGTNEIKNSNSGETAAYETKSMDEEAVIKEEETGKGKNKTAAGAANGNKAAKVQETKGREAVEEKKQDLEGAAAKQDEEKKQDLEVAAAKQDEEKKQDLEDAAAKQDEENKQESEVAAPEKETAEEKKEESDNAAPENAVGEKKEGSENTAPENAVEEKEESNNATPEHAVEEKKQELDNVAPEHVVEEKKQGLDNAAPKLTFQAEKPDPAFAAPKLRPVQGKAGSAVSNDVIEEAVVKLRERKNKVRALAGAFETVIALQDNKR